MNAEEFGRIVSGGLIDGLTRTERLHAAVERIRARRRRRIHYRLAHARRGRIL